LGADKATIAAATAAAGGAVGALVVYGPLMLKVKDWPPADDFLSEMPRHMVVRSNGVMTGKGVVGGGVNAIMQVLRPFLWCKDMVPAR
jgi:hypothetical protein